MRTDRKQVPSTLTKNDGMTMTASSTGTGLLAEINEFVHRAYGASLEDGYSAISLWPAVSKSFWAPGDRYLAQLPARKALFDSIFRETKRMWLVTLNIDPRKYVRGQHKLDCRPGWTMPDWNMHVENALCGVEGPPAAFDAHALVEAAATAGTNSVIFIDPDRKAGFRPGDVSTPALVFAGTHEDLDQILVDRPVGNWF